MKTITRVYDTYPQAQGVVSDLEASGITADHISILANKHVSKEYSDAEPSSGAATGAGLGAAVGGGAGLLAGLGLLAIPGLGPVVAAGWLAVTALGAAGGAAAGGIIGLLVGTGVSEDDAHVYSEAIRRGGTMVTVRYDDKDEMSVTRALNKQTPIDPNKRRTEYQSAGWTAFDAEAPEYNLTDSEIESRRRRG